MDEPVPMETGGQATEPVTAQPASAGAEATAPPAPPASASAVEQEQPQPPAATPAAAAPEARKPAAKADGDEAKARQIALPQRLLTKSPRMRASAELIIADPPPSPVRPRTMQPAHSRGHAHTFSPTAQISLALAALSIGTMSLFGLLGADRLCGVTAANLTPHAPVDYRAQPKQASKHQGI